MTGAGYNYVEVLIGDGISRPGQLKFKGACDDWEQIE